MVPAGKVALSLSARFGKEAPAINGGLVWRVYDAKPDAEGKFQLVKEDKKPAPTAGAAGRRLYRACRLRARHRGQAGDAARADRARGVRSAGRRRCAWRARSATCAFRPSRSRSTSSRAASSSQRRRPPADRRARDDRQLVVVPEGIYYIVSHYGDANAVVRSDIRVQAGKLTDITVNHRAAAITLKLVTEKGGEALANTAWSVLTPGGDVIKELLGAFPRVILAEGEYRAIARNEGKVYEREFKVDRRRRRRRRGAGAVTPRVGDATQSMRATAPSRTLDPDANRAAARLRRHAGRYRADAGRGACARRLVRVAGAPARADRRRAGAGERAADRRSRPTVLAAQAAGGRRPWRRDARARRRDRQRGDAAAGRRCATG